MKCEDCKHKSRYQRFNNITVEWTCKHPNIIASASKYEKENKRINKSGDFIGFKLPKTCLRWCPLKSGAETKLKEN